MVNILRPSPPLFGNQALTVHPGRLRTLESGAPIVFVFDGTEVDGSGGWWL